MPREADDFMVKEFVDEVGSQSEAGRRVGISQRAIGYYLRGRPIPEPTWREMERQWTIATAERLADTYTELGNTPCSRGAKLRGKVHEFSDHLQECPICLHAFCARV